MSCMYEVYIEHVMPPSNKRRLEQMLLQLDRTIIPRLSDRVNIDEYALKLSQYAELFYVTSQGEDIGHCAIYMNSESYGFISSIAILKEWQGRGIGKLLWNQVLNCAIEKRIKRIELMVHKENKNAIIFYQKNGFEIVEKTSGWMRMHYDF